MPGTYHAIVVLPGTTGTSLVETQGAETSDFPLWSYKAIREAMVGGALVAPQLEKDLWAGVPGGYKTRNDDKKVVKGYPSLINAIVSAANAAGNNYQALYSSWPTNNPATVTGQSQQKWLPGPLTGDAVIGWGYDWRQDNKITATMLQNFLYNLTNFYNVGKITLIGHSMGGLVSRGYLEAVGKNDPNLALVDQLITLGTPHLGAPLALAPISHTLQINMSGSGNGNFLLKLWEDDIVGPVKQVAADNIVAMIDAVVNSPSGASTYQLLPPNLGTGFTNFISAPVQNTSCSIFAQPLPGDLQKLLNSTGENQGNLSGAAKFFSTLSYTSNPNPKIAYNCIYGVVETGHESADPKLKGQVTTVVNYTYDSAKTPALFPYEKDGGGDLVVPAVSAMFTGNSSVSAFQILGADHITMPSNENVQAKVNQLLGFTS